jgi:hypothetical protein
MLYFSKVGIDSDTVDLDKIGKLRQLKANIKGLVESYKSIIEFEEKFTRQLDHKISELQDRDASGELPLSLKFVSVENGQPIGSSLIYAFDHQNVTDFDVAPIKERETLKSFAITAIKVRSYFPVVLAIENSSPSGIRNLYVELDVSTTADNVEVSDSPGDLLGLASGLPIFFGELGATTTSWFKPSSLFTHDDKISERVRRALVNLDVGKLQRIDRGWRLSFEWEALQPQRTRLIRPALYVYSPESANISVRAKVFADSFPEPLVLEANVRVEVNQSFTDLSDLLPDWEKLLTENGSAKE